VSASVAISTLAKAAQINPPLNAKLPLDEPVCFVPMAAVSAETARVESSITRLYSEVSKGYTPFLSGDILFAKITPCFENGKIAQALLPLRNGFGSTEFHVIRPVPGVSDGRYLHYFLRLDRVRSEGQRRMTGSGGQRRVPATYLAELEIPLPPLPEQRRIAAILDQADTLRTQRRAALAQLDSLTQSLFLDMFGDPVTNPKGWDIKHMSELFASTPIFGTMIPGDASGGAWLCLRVANIQDWQLTLADQKYVDLPNSMIERHSVKDGDLLMARAIATQDHLGKCIVARPGKSQWAFDSHLMRLRFAPDRALPDFIRQALRTPGGRSIFLKASRKSSVQYNINTKEISALALPLPPLPLQQTFATRVQAIEALKTQHRAALAAQDALFASLQQRAFAGTL
jgi:type I restriction enzyme S subunit